MDGDNDYFDKGGQQPSSSSAASSSFIPRIADAGTELDSVCRAEISSNTTSGNNMNLGFPPLCLALVRLLSGNQCCVDCGEEQSNRLIYASVGYGTLFCIDCAYRHRTITPDESDIGHLLNEHWDLHSILALFEGGNTNMLEFVKNKPGWKPSNKDKGTLNTDPEDILAFKQVYLSHAASVYRKLVISRTDKVKYIRINAMHQEDAAKEEVMDFSSYPRQSDPIQRILDQNNMSEDDISGGLFNIIDATAKEDKGGLSERTTGGGMTKQPHEAPNIDLIKQRINMRRAMNPSINALNHQWHTAATTIGVADKDAEFDNGRNDMFMHRANLHLEQHTQQSANDATDALQQVRFRMRRSSGDLIGEVRDTSMKHDQCNNEYAHEYVRKSIQQQVNDDDNETMISYATRTYNTNSQAPTRPMYRPAIEDR